MPQYELVIRFEDPEPGTITDPADIAALGRHAEEITAWLRECTYPFRFTGSGIEKLDGGSASPEPGLTTAEARGWNVSVIRKDGDLPTRSRITGALSTTHTATLLSAYQAGGKVTRFPLVNVLEWTETPVTVRVPV